ncbi:MAG: hypothetical protein NW223_21255 [Hyphomicrobiaceae bacterium]|nr:hypothetical protein [Hyphomicrobiaceae bacterium]
MSICIAAGALLWAPAAMAQQSEQGKQNVKAQNQNQGQNQPAHSQQRAMTQDKLRKSLQDAGFKSVRVVDAAYLVQAQSEDGENVLMYINPPSTSGAAANLSGQGGSDTPSGSSKSQ